MNRSLSPNCDTVLPGILRSTKKKEKVRPPISPEKVSRGALIWNVQVIVGFCFWLFLFVSLLLRYPLSHKK